MKMNKSFRDTRDKIHSSTDYVPYDTLENRLANRFNDFFFSSATSCGSMFCIYSFIYFLFS